jgi:hypothetical protein
LTLAIGGHTVTARLPLPQADEILPSSLPHDLTRELVLDCLARIQASPQFAASDRLKRFLGYVVHETLSGSEGDLKEYAVGIHVYDRGEEFDPAHDSIVRTEAARLRKRLEQYYRNEGSSDLVRLHLPRGGYVPRFESVQPAPVACPTPPRPIDASIEPSAVTSPPRRVVWRARWAVAVVVLLAANLWLVGALVSGGVSPALRIDSKAPFVLVGEFTNRSGDPRLQGTLEGALELELGRAGLAPALPRPRIDDVLRLMIRPSNSPLSPELAREVALRDGGVRAIVTGAIDKLGDRYVFSGRIAFNACGLDS